MWWLGVLFVVIYVISKLKHRLKVSHLNKTVLITGCDHGIGYLLAKYLDSQDVRVIACCLTENGAKLLSKECSNKINVQIMDVTSQDSIDLCFENAKKLCPSGIWAIINNAGIVADSNFELNTMEVYRNTFEVNFFGLVAVTKKFLPLVKICKGRIVNMSSAAGRIAAPGMSAYGASKFAVEGFSDSLRREMSVWGVKVVLVEPGFMRTPLLDRVPDTLKKRWEALPQATRDAYGEDFLQKSIDSYMDLTKFAADPMSVVREACEAVFARYPKHRYLCGMDCKYIFAPLSMIPSSISDFLTTVLGMPIPAAAKKK